MDGKILFSHSFLERVGGGDSNDANDTQQPKVNTERWMMEMAVIASIRCA